mmetsp:Transcript_33208/g.91884  ORF Transcript_33208/g.91884 Transcript_33208/m.91884 type:complete len:201 (-) Transcript_33208:431-1033(-)
MRRCCGSTQRRRRQAPRSRRASCSGAPLRTHVPGFPRIGTGQASPARISSSLSWTRQTAGVATPPPPCGCSQRGTGSGRTTPACRLGRLTFRSSALNTTRAATAVTASSQRSGRATWACCPPRAWPTTPAAPAPWSATSRRWRAGASARPTTATSDRGTATPASRQSKRSSTTMDLSCLAWSRARTSCSILKASTGARSR